jgi:hypothetical protein
VHVSTLISLLKSLLISLCDNRDFRVSKLNISKNDFRAEGGRALAVGLKGNQVMTELNIAGNKLTLNASADAYDDMSGVIAVANTISGMGALSSLNLSSNMLTGPFGGEMSGNMPEQPV